ncbi:RYamide neuropeptides-like [Harmonia axyridis]|uniref:RYamide neuropeptides-like n=1 Tax=Harmonia axyridis TaxID=115357 RepID=UPI001E278329|nr:RYamide neuropeptides-like [Harmonia axyridis]
MNILLSIIGVSIFLLDTKEALLTTRYGKKNINTDDIRPRSVKNIPSFFVGPRYGKRMTWSTREDQLPSPHPCTTYGDLSCDYTGYSNYYRCSLRRDREGEEEDFADSY